MPLDDDTFIAALLEQPQEEMNWLVYADWLEERGDPRAALYRHRCVTNTVGMKLVLVPRGNFWMGNHRGRQRQVEVPHDFYLGAYPVTQEQWQSVMGSNPSWFSRSGRGPEAVARISDADLKQFPVELVTWDDVQEFLKRLNAREKDSGLMYHLPTEAEWEYACRGGASSQHDCAFDFYFSRPTSDLSSKKANFNLSPLRRTSKVGSYPPNRLGIYDMHGNVWEWCGDMGRGSSRVIRGGSWNYNSSSCRASSRRRNEPSDRHTGLGVRVAAVPSGE
jgi:uncharacterized protein (TIGR02996 family)